MKVVERMNFNIRQFVISILFYVLLFIMPVIMYLKYKNKVNPLEFLKLNNNIFKNILKGVIFGLSYIILLVIRNEFTRWGIVNLDIGILWVNAILVGLFEEVTFRGFILQKFWRRRGFWTANVITTILFVLIHIPKWLFYGISIGTSALNIFIISMVLGYLFKEYNSLWIPIICHTIIDLTAWIGLR